MSSSTWPHMGCRSSLAPNQRPQSPPCGPLCNIHCTFLSPLLFCTSKQTTLISSLSSWRRNGGCHFVVCRHSLQSGWKYDHVARLVFTNFGLSRWFLGNVNSALVSLHFVDMNSVANISEVCTALVFGVAPGGLGYSSCLCRSLFHESN
jgi:hypothetical protein